MTRFEIQDIASQNYDGVTFRALDNSTKQIVSLRRFFPFGQDEEGGEGLDAQEGKAFSSACLKLSEVHHPALRKTIFGDTDPVDGMPFLVTEWIDGESLADVLGNNTMDPSLIIGLVRQALDVCLTLSSALGNEAIWIDTKLESIIVSNPSENPSFSFRICPFKWLGTQSHEKDLTGIATMVEALMGWKSKLVSDQGGLGLGGWLKMLRQHPEMNIQAALDSLPRESTKPFVVPAETAYDKPSLPFIVPTPNQPFFNKKNVTIMALSACLTGALIIFLYQQNVKKADPITSTIDNENVIVEEQPETLEISPKTETNTLSTETTIPNPETTIPNPETTAPTPETTAPTPETTAPTSERTTPTPEIAALTPGTTALAPETITLTTATIAPTPETITLTTATTSPKPETTSPTTTLWSPAEIITAAWYDSTKAIIKDGTVSIVNAGSGGGAISGPASLASSGIGNLQAVQFNGTNQYLTGDITNKGTTLTVFFVGKSLNTNQAPYAGIMSIWENSQMYDWNNASSAVLFSQNNTLANSIYTHRNSNILSSSTGTLTTGFLATAVFNGSTHTLYLNGTPSAGIASTDSFNANKVIVGARWQKSAVAEPYWNGNFGEAIICNTDLSTSDRQKIEGYLAHKWGLAGELPTDQPYKSSAPVATPSVIDVLTPQNTEYIKTLKDGEPVTLQGTVRSAKLSSTEKSIYISFSDPVVETDIRVVIHGNDYEGGAFTEAGFAPLIGKTLVFHGTVYAEKFNDRPPFVKITDKKQIKLATSEVSQKSSAAVKLPNSNTSESKTSSDIPVFSPDDFEAISKLELKKPAAVKGVLKSVKIPKPGSGLYFTFSDPGDIKKIQAVAYPKSFEGKTYTDDEFVKLENDLQKLLGKTVLFEGTYVTQVGNKARCFVHITSLNQIKETE